MPQARGDSLLQLTGNRENADSGKLPHRQQLPEKCEINNSTSPMNLLCMDTPLLLHAENIQNQESHRDRDHKQCQDRTSTSEM